MTINYGIPVYHRCTVNVKSSLTEIIKPRLEKTFCWLSAGLDALISCIDAQADLSALRFFS